MSSFSTGGNNPLSGFLGQLGPAAGPANNAFDFVGSLPLLSQLQGGASGKNSFDVQTMLQQLQDRANIEALMGQLTQASGGMPSSMQGVMDKVQSGAAKSPVNMDSIKQLGGMEEIMAKMQEMQQMEAMKGMLENIQSGGLNTEQMNTLLQNEKVKEALSQMA